ncbi:phage late control D family protein [Pandoraea apista]|uniref:phage late control D family protein n=1 Tax=Pandoraea apista TaxID=93218 RepID=UPI000F675159|nr:phage late control D family protein [Pandoraea apista]RRW94276.1 phage late control D family protein [Pandoraea apista]RRX00634.1 phage late control D family protein [Pandoraea apista]
MAGSVVGMAGKLLGAQDDMVPVPIYRITKDGKDITGAFTGRLISLSLEENRGFEADQLDIELDDADGTLELPSRGAKLAVAFGWKHEGLIDKGKFTVDEITHTGPPDRIVIRARSADLRSGLTKKRESSYHNVSLLDLVNLIAQRHNLGAMIASALANQLLSHIDQTGESDASFLTRVAKMFDAIATVKADKLLFTKLGQSLTASGKPLSRLTITRQLGDQHHFSVADRESFDSVVAYYQDTRAAKKGQVVVTSVAETSTSTSTGTANGSAKKRKNVKPEAPVVEPTGNTKELRHTYASKTNALRAARAEWQRIQRGVATFSMTLARGNAELFPEVPVSVRGFKPQIDNTDWLLAKTRHTLDSNSGFTTQIELEIKATEVPDEKE